MKNITEVIERESQVIKEAAYNGYCQMPEHSEILSALDRIAEAANKQQPSDGGAFERVARNEEWYNNGRIVGKDQDMGIGTVISVQQAQFIVDAHSWTIAELSRAHNSDRAADKQRIAELEAQVPKTVTPDKADKGPHGLYGGRCECSHLLIGGEKFCPVCGSKLDWSEA